MSTQKIKKSIEKLFLAYLRDELNSNSSSSSSSSSSPSGTSSYSSNSSSDREMSWYTGMTEDPFYLPSIVIICQDTTLDVLSFNWTCKVDVGIYHHYADITRAEHNDKVAEIRDYLIVDTDDICPILDQNELGIDALLYTPTDTIRKVENKKYITIQKLELKCNFNG